LHFKTEKSVSPGSSVSSPEGRLIVPLYGRIHYFAALDVPEIKDAGNDQRSRRQHHGQHENKNRWLFTQGSKWKLYHVLAGELRPYSENKAEIPALCHKYETNCKDL
jgi:hypothetical protein